VSGQVAVVIGMGRSGAACARVLDAEGYHVRVIDRSHADERSEALARSLPGGIEVVMGGYRDDVVDEAALVCPSPGVPWDAAILVRARQLGIPVRSEMQLVFDRCPAPIVGITGTNGKTTTTALTGAVIAAGGSRVHVGGNIGETMLDRLYSVRRDDWVVLELSSFQLESVARPRCRLAAVLNITPDHLDRHRTLEDYVAAKRRLVEATDEVGTVVLGADDDTVRAMAPATRARVLLFGGDLGGGDGTTVRDGDIVSVEQGAATPVMRRADIPLFGEHNVLNVLAAVALGRAAGIAPDGIAGAVRGFRAVPHRLEPVLDEAGVLWVDDSKATNADAAIKALQSFADRPIVWIGGGGTKGVPPDSLAEEVVRRARHAVLNGATAAELDAALAARDFTARTVVATLAEAVAEARAVARPGDVVLLAPGYTSFDQFIDFEERGRVFAALVRETAAARSQAG
jgi:UDP-N-acetylmuramoylalanine--D-glutamate ligase